MKTNTKKAKLLSLILAALMMLSACAGGNEGDAETDSKKDKTEKTEETSAESAEKETETVESKAPETAAPETAAPETAAPENPVASVTLSVGSVENNVYSNPTLNIKFTMDESWVYEVPTQADLEEWLASDPTTFLFFNSMSETTLSSINIGYSLVDDELKALTSVITNDTMVNALYDDKDTAIAMYEEEGMTDVTMEVGSLTWKGQDISVLKTKCNMLGIDIFMIQFFDVIDDNYYATYTFVSYMVDESAQLISMFSSLQ